MLLDIYLIWLHKDLQFSFPWYYFENIIFILVEIIGPINDVRLYHDSVPIDMELFKQYLDTSNSN